WGSGQGRSRALRPAQVFAQAACSDVLGDGLDAQVLAALEVLFRKSDLLIGSEQLGHSLLHVPGHLELRQRARELVEAHTVAARIRAGVLRKLDPAAGHLCL